EQYFCCGKANFLKNGFPHFKQRLSSAEYFMTLGSIVPFLFPTVLFREVSRVLDVVTGRFPERLLGLWSQRRCCVALPTTRHLDGQRTRLTLNSELLHDLQSRRRDESFVAVLDRVEVFLTKTSRTSISGLCDDLECRECRLRRRV